jgi:hypothetical protein
LLQTLPEVGEVGVRRNEDIARCAVEKRIASLEVVYGVRVLFAASEQEVIGRYGR